MKLIEVLQQFDSLLSEQGFPTNYVVVEKETDSVGKLIKYEQPDTGTELVVNMDMINNRANLAVVHLYGYGKGIDLV